VIPEASSARKRRLPDFGEWFVPTLEPEL